MQLVALEEVLAITRLKLADRLVCVASDGASVNLGCETGIIARLREEVCPGVENIHCYGHCVQVCHGSYTMLFRLAREDRRQILQQLVIS